MMTFGLFYLGFGLLVAAHCSRSHRIPVAHCLLLWPIFALGIIWGLARLIGSAARGRRANGDRSRM